MWILRIERMFSAAHSIAGHPKCGQVHGHNWKVTVEFRAWQLIEPGWVLDFATAKQGVDTVLQRYDHININTILDPPTAEILAANLFTELRAVFQKVEHLAVHSVTVEETPGCSATFTNAAEEIVSEKRGSTRFVRDQAIKLEITDMLQQLVNTLFKKEEWHA